MFTVQNQTGTISRPALFAIRERSPRAKNTPQMVILRHRRKVQIAVIEPTRTREEGPVTGKHSTRRGVTSVAATAIGLICVLGARDAHADKVLHFGIVPQQSATQLAKAWIPFIREVSRRVQLQIAFATARDIPALEKCLAQGAYELAYMNPYHYTVFHGKAGYQAFARQAKKRLQGVIVVRDDSPIKTLDDLAGAKFAFPSPAAFGASVLPRAEMRSRGIVFEPAYVKSHDSVYRAVAAGLFPAGGGVTRTFNALDPVLRGQLRIVYRTKAYTPHAFAASPKVRGDDAARIASAMVTVAETHPDLAKAIGINAFEPAKDADWNDVRTLGMTPEETGLATGSGAKCLSD
jgi:phosphonate transport system substrate-binding protein